MCKPHFWIIDSQNKGVCKYCSEKHDFTPDNKRAFPKDYSIGYSANCKMIRDFHITGEYYMQGRISGSPFDTYDVDY